MADREVDTFERLQLPEGLLAWWAEHIGPWQSQYERETSCAKPIEELEIFIGSSRFRSADGEREEPWHVATLRPRHGLLRVARARPPFKKALTPLSASLSRAGWRRPLMDPMAMAVLMDLRAAGGRVEFILDTNALVEGVGHWLVDHFGDRCDLVLTAVTQHELQNQAAIARPPRPETKPKRGDKSVEKGFTAQHLYLAGARFREWPGYPNLIWRPLDVGDTALMLIGDTTGRRSNAGQKSSEADTLLLRQVGRSIQARVRNLTRLFVTGDTALARRAAVELAMGSVVNAQVDVVRPGEVLMPCSWWPGPNEGRSVARHPARLVWELLALGDWVELRLDDRRPWRFTAHANPMWPSDYGRPWVEVLASPSGSAMAWAEATTGAAVTALAEQATELSAGASAAGDMIASDGAGGDGAGGDGTFWPGLTSRAETMGDNLRLPIMTLLDLLAFMAVTPSGQERIALPNVYSHSVRPSHLRRLLAALNLAAVDADGVGARLLPGASRLRQIWSQDDAAGLYSLLCGWAPLREWAELAEPPARPARTQSCARAWARTLEQGGYDPRNPKRWLPGGSRPRVAEMRAAVLAAVAKEGSAAIPIFRLLVDVFHDQLGVCPARVIRRWADLWRVGVFEGFEPREGGSSSGRFQTSTLVLQPGGWQERAVDLEAIGGVRDLVHRSAS